MQQTVDGATVTDQDNVAFANLTLNTLFKDLEVSLRGKLTTDSASSAYAYKAYLDSVLKFQDGSIESWGEAEGFYQDTPTRMDDTDAAVALFARSH